MSLFSRRMLDRTPLLLGLCLGGCGLFSSNEPTLRLEPKGRYIVYDQRFASAAYMVHPDGEYDLVLDSRQWTSNAEKDVPLQPSGIPAPRQIMHIHVAWRPSIGMKANNPAATNSIINWYVIDDTDPHSPKYIHYQGTGLVKIYAESNSAEFHLQPTELAIAHQRGNLSDPFGAGRLSGNFEATRDNGRVTALLSDLETTLSTGEFSPAIKPVEPAGAPPARNPVGP